MTRYISFILVMLMALNLANVYSQNLVVNGGFEDEEQGRLVGWRDLWTREPNVGEVALDYSVKYEGNKALKVVHRGERDWSFEQSERIEVEPGEIFRITGWVKCERVKGAVNLSVVTRDKNDQVMEWLWGQVWSSGTHDWKELHRRLVVPLGCATIEFRLTGWGVGTIWFDSLSLLEEGEIMMITAVPGVSRFGNPYIDVEFDGNTGLMKVWDKRSQRVWQQVGVSKQTILQGVTGLKKERGIKVQLLDADNVISVGVKIMVAADSPDLVVEISGDANVDMYRALSYLQPFIAEGGSKGWWLVLPVNEGLIYPVDDLTVQPYNWLVGYSGHGLCMAWFGITDFKSGYMAIVDTPDDMKAEVHSVDGYGWVIHPTWEASKGKFRYNRKISYWFTDKGGYVALAKHYRKYLEQIGRFKSLKEKRKENKNVDLLIGAPDVWVFEPSMQTKVEIYKELNSLGVKRMLCADAYGANEIDEVNKMGFLTSRYDIYQDVWPPGEPEDANHEGWPEDLVLLPDGTPMSGWVIRGKDKNYPGGVICSIPGLERARQKIPADLAKNHYTTRFIDTTTATPWRECWNPNHPTTRTEDKIHKMKLLEFVSSTCGLVTGSETGIDAAVPYVHYFEGMLSLGPYRLPDAGYEVMKYVPPTPEFLKFQVGPYYRVPLWELVYHDAVVSTWYWGDSSHKAPEVWDQRDLINILYGTPPLWLFDKAIYDRYKQRFVRCYKSVCEFVQRVGYDGMLSHEFLTADHKVQMSKFSSGVGVIVNFSDKDYRTRDGKIVKPMGYLVFEFVM